MINFDLIQEVPLRFVAERFAAFAIKNGITVEPVVKVSEYTPVSGYYPQYHLVYTAPNGEEFVFDVNVAATEGDNSNDWKIRWLRQFFGLSEAPEVSFSEFIHAPKPAAREVDGKMPINISTEVAASPIGKEIAPGYFQAAGAPVPLGQFFGQDGHVYQAVYLNLATGKENDGLFFSPNAWKRIS